VALEAALGGAYEIAVYGPRSDVPTAVRMFSRAAAVVGVHGGGFQNMQFCEPNTTVVHIGWGAHYRDTADAYGLRYHLARVPSMSRESTNLVLDVANITATVQLALAEDGRPAGVVIGK
jgi:capsular polysaccharide biosynthesis protein